MNPTSLTPEARRRLALLFAPVDHAAAEQLLSQLPANSCQATDRLTFAALKLSAGNLAKLRVAVDLANTDWRDLLVAAGFAHDAQAHRSWLPTSADSP